MAELAVFGYRSGTGPLYRLDIRVKLASLVLISLASLRMGPLGLCALTLGLFYLLRSTPVSCLTLLRELRFFLILLALILSVRACAFSATPVFAVSVSAAGFHAGALICWRLLVVVFLGVLFVSTTRTHEVKAGVEWILKPAPLIPGKRVSTMIALLMRFVPVIVHQAMETADAQRARGIENRKNPLYRMIKLTIPLFRRTLQDADKLALAMEARCYSENRTDPFLKATRKDWTALSAVVGSCILLMFL